MDMKKLILAETMIKDHHNRGLRFMNATTQKERDVIYAEEMESEKEMLQLIQEIMLDDDLA